MEGLRCSIFNLRPILYGRLGGRRGGMGKRRIFTAVYERDPGKRSGGDLDPLEICVLTPGSFLKKGKMT